MWFLVSRMYNQCVIGSLIIGFLALINIFMLFATIMADPGVNPSIYLRYSQFYDKEKGEY